MRDVGGRLLVLVLLVALVLGAWWYGRHQADAGGSGNPAEVAVLVPPTQARWTMTERDRFNAKNLGLYHVAITVREPGEALKEVLSGREKPAACGADDPHWLAGLIAAWAAGHKGAHIAAFDDVDDYYVYFKSPQVIQAASAGRKSVPTSESVALAGAVTNTGLRVVYPNPAPEIQRCAATLSAPWVTSDQRDGAQAFLKFLATRSALQDGLRDHWRPVTSDAGLTLAPELRRHAGQGFRLTYRAARPRRPGGG